MTETPLISLGLIVYNGERYLRETLDSILAQDFTDFELIISDNASEDQTEKICRRYAEREPRIRYVRHEENRGPVWNCNYTFSLARGEYFKFATHDDLLGPSHLRRCIETFEKAPAAVVVVYPQTMLIGPGGEEIGRYDDRLDLRSASPSQRLGHLVRRMRMCSPMMGLVRKSALDRTRLWRNIVGSDNLLLAELSLLGPLWEVPEIHYYRRLHPQASGIAYKSLRKRISWLDPRNRSWKASFPITRLLVEHLRIIEEAPLPLGERIRALWIYLLSHAYSRLRHRSYPIRRRARLLASKLKGMLSGPF